MRTIATGLAVLGIATFAIALLATLPASLVAHSLKLKPGVAVTGTLWSGEAGLANGDLVSWNTDLLRSLMSLNLQSQLLVKGNLTDLSAKMSATGDGVKISEASGIAGWSLVRTAIPEIDLDCDIGVRLEDSAIAIRNGIAVVFGRATSSAGVCRGTGTTQAFDAPATLAVATTAGGASEVRITLASDPSAQLAALSIGAEGQMRATVEPLALKLAQGANASGSVVYEMRAP